MEAEADVNAAFARFKELADRKSDIFDEDILALVMDEAVTSRARALPAAVAWRSTRERASGRRRRSSSPPARSSTAPSSDGNGPVDASLKAIESKVGSGAEMLLYSVNAITSGSTESQGEVTVRLQHGGPGRQRRRCRSGHRRRVGESLPRGVEQAAQQDGTGRGPGLTGAGGLQGGPFRACCLTLGTVRKFLILRAFPASPRLRAPPAPEGRVLSTVRTLVSAALLLCLAAVATAAAPKSTAPERSVPPPRPPWPRPRQAGQGTAVVVVRGRNGALRRVGAGPGRAGPSFVRPAVPACTTQSMRSS